MEYWLPLLLIAVMCLVLGLRTGRPTRSVPFVSSHPSPLSPGSTAPLTSTPLNHESASTSELLPMEIIPAGLQEPTPPRDPFDEKRVHQDLVKLSGKTGLISQTWALHKQTKQREKEIRLVNQYGEFFASATQMITAKNEMLRARNEFLGMERENEEKNAAKEATIAKHRADVLRYEAEAEEHRRRITELKSPPSPPEPKLTPAQQRILKKAEIDEQLSRLKTAEAEAVAKAGDDLERRRIQNMYANRREQIYEQQEKNL